MRWPWGAPWIEHFAYDPNGNLIATGNAHVEVTREFDAEGLLLKEIQQHASGDCFIIESAYDAAGNRVLRKSNKGNQIRYAFDLLDEPAEIRINDAAPITIRRDALGQITEEELAPGLKRSYRYNADGLMTEQALRKDATELFRTAYRYDPAGNLTERHDSEFGTDVYLYDPMGRILAHTDPRGAIHRFLNDPAGDRLLTRIAESDGWKREGEYQGTRYRFNRAGNLVRKDDAGKRLDLAWDASQRLIASHRTDAGGRRVTTTYAYDPLGRRLFKETDGRRTWFGWDVDALALDVIDGKPREFVYRPGTFEPVAITNGNVLLYENDANGCPRKVLDRSGALVWSAQFAAWGGCVQAQEGIRNPVLLQGQYLDHETELSYNRHRYYDSECGQFVSCDPVGLVAGESPYEFAANVTAWIDPLGLSCASDAKKLARSLGKPPSKHYRPHHIVMSNSKDKRMKALRKKMKTLGIGVNDAENGIWLPKGPSSRKAGTTATAHAGEGVHGNAYKQHVWDTLKNANTKTAFLNGLSNLESELFSGKVFPVVR